MEEPLQLTLSADSVYCVPIYGDLPALELTWTAGTNHGTGSAISYTIDMDREGNNFAGGISWAIGRTADRTMALSHSHLADTLRILYPEWQPEHYAVYELRVRAKVLMSGEEQVSPVTKVAIAYNSSSLTALYLVGEATPNGWSLDRATPMIMDMSDFAIFSWTGQMHRGEFKLMTTTDDWLPCYVRDSVDATRMVYREQETDYPDLKWNIEQTGTYRITANTRDLTIAVTYLGGEAYSHVYMIGDATPGGWSWDNLTEMQHPETNVFTWQGHLSSGQIKFPTEIRSDWSGEMIYAPEADCTPTEDGTFDIHSGDPDYKWVISTPGEYQIRIHITEGKIGFVKL